MKNILLILAVVVIVAVIIYLRLKSVRQKKIVNIWEKLHDSGGNCMAIEHGKKCISYIRFYRIRYSSFGCKDEKMFRKFVCDCAREYIHTLDLEFQDIIRKKSRLPDDAEELRRSYTEKVNEIQAEIRTFENS